MAYTKEMLSIFRRKCKDSRPCFGRVNGGCTLLGVNVKRMYEDGKCPFCKPHRDITNGVYYPPKEYFSDKD